MKYSFVITALLIIFSSIFWSVALLFAQTDLSISDDTTDTTSPMISNVRAVEITNSVAHILWDTDDLSDSRVLYSVGPSLSEYKNISKDRCDDGGLVTSHCVRITNLAADTTYYYRVESKNEAGLDAYSDTHSFTTMASDTESTDITTDTTDTTTNTTTETDTDTDTTTTEEEMIMEEAATDGASENTIAGTVRFDDGTPVADAEVGAYWKERGTWTSTVTDANGAYALSVGAGTFELGVRPATNTAIWTYKNTFPTVQFEDDGMAETKSVLFTVPTANATLVVVIVDEDTISLAGAGVVVADSHTERFGKSDTNGVVTFTLAEGDYRVRAHLPFDKGYLNPDEQTVLLNADETKTITHVFKKRGEDTVVTLAGTTALSDGTPVGALVWAWSEAGGATEAYADTNGHFTLQVAKNTVWHIAAGKKFEGFGYLSAEVMVNVGASAPPAIALTLMKIRDESLASAIATDRDATQEIVVKTTDGAEVRVPSSSAAPSGTVSVVIEPTVEAPSQTGKHVVGAAYDVSVRDERGEDVRTFAEAIEVVIPYTEEDLAARGVTEDEIVPNFFDDATGAWVPIDNYTVDMERNIVIARVAHLTRFAIVASSRVSALSNTLKPQVSKPSATPSTQQQKLDLFRDLSVGMRGDDVTQLQEFLLVEGVYPEGLTTGYFGTLTKQAVIRFQEKYASDVLWSVGLAKGTGFVGPSTRKKANALGYMKQKGTVFPPGQQTKAELFRDLSVGMRGDDVTQLQEFLLVEGVYPEGLTTGYFGTLTKQAVIRFQEKYSGDILVPVGLIEGTGFVGPSTRKKILKLQ